MKLSSRSRYGLRLMFELAITEREGPVLLKDIARRQKISEKYLSKLVIPLRSAKLISSVRGMHGGYMLSRSPSKITVKEIVETLEGDLSMVECGGDVRDGYEKNRSPIRALWCKLDDAIIKILTENSLKTLADEYREIHMNEAITFEI